MRPDMTETSTVGGERLTVTKLFAVIPQTSPFSSHAVSTATPVANREAAWRNVAGLACRMSISASETEAREFAGMRISDHQAVHRSPHAMARTGSAGADILLIQA